MTEYIRVEVWQTIFSHKLRLKISPISRPVPALTSDPSQASALTPIQTPAPLLTPNYSFNSRVNLNLNISSNPKLNLNSSISNFSSKLRPHSIHGINMSTDPNPSRRLTLNFSPNIRPSPSNTFNSNFTSTYLQSHTQPYARTKPNPEPTSNLSYKPRLTPILCPNPWLILNLNFNSYLNSSPDISSNLVTASPVPQLQSQLSTGSVCISALTASQFSPSMSMNYENFHSVESDRKSWWLRNGLSPPQPFLRHLCSGACPLLFCLGLNLLLLVGICVIGSQNSKFQRDLVTLRTNWRNVTSNTAAEIQALHSHDGSLQETITSLKAKVENHEQELQAARSLKDKVSSLGSKLEKEQQERKEDYSEMLLRVQQLAKDLTSLNCEMAALKSNDTQKTCCPVNWLEHEGSCYWFSRTVKPWNEAEKYCQLENAHLVVINSREEQNFVQEHTGYSYTWMGLSDPEGIWKWVDGTDYETSLKNWKPGQPNDWHGHGLGGGEDCAHFLSDGRWNDDVCLRPYRWVCEASLSKAS